MRRISLLVLALVLSASAAFAQVAFDLADPLYTDLGLWRDRGLITALPPMRPYPPQLVKTLLQEVRSAGTAADADQAARYLRELEGAFRIRLETSGQLRTDFDSLYQQYQAGVAVTGSATPWISYSGRIGAVASNGRVDDLLPAGFRPVTDVIYDTAVTPLGSTELVPRVSSGGAVAFGSDSLYFQAGIVRSSFGPIWEDNIVLGPAAPQSGQFSFVIRGTFFTYTSLLLALSAVKSDGTGRPAPGKYLALHSVEVTPLPWLTLGAFESVTWGNRFELLYLIPLPSMLYYAQGLVGFPDNSFMGFSGEARLPANLSTTALLYVDDAAFNDLVKLQLNTMLVLAGQAEVRWTPHLPFLEQVRLGYTLVTPYTYSHRGAVGLNYTDYTNAGQNMGPSLEPNSDRLQLDYLARPLPMLEVSAFGRLIRHGNASAGIDAGDGTIFDDGFDGNVPTFTPGAGYVLPPGILNYTRFLTQSVIEHTWQLGLTARATLATSFGDFHGSFSYTYEYRQHANLGPTDIQHHYLSLEVGFAF